MNIVSEGKTLLLLSREGIVRVLDNSLSLALSSEQNADAFLLTISQLGTPILTCWFLPLSIICFLLIGVSFPNSRFLLRNRLLKKSNSHRISCLLNREQPWFLVFGEILNIAFEKQPISFREIRCML